MELRNFTFFAATALALSLYSANAQAYEWHLDMANALTETDWSKTGGTETTDGLWFRYANPADTSSEKIFIKNALPAATDSITIGDNKQTTAFRIVVDSANLTLGSLSLSGNSWGSGAAFLSRGGLWTNLTLTGNLITSGLNTSATNFGTIRVEGDITRTGSNFSLTNTKRLEVLGNVVGGMNFYLGTFGSVKERTDANNGTNTFENGIANADTVISGYIKTTKFHIKTDGAYDSYISANGLTDTTICRDGLPNSKNSTSYFILTNTGAFSSNGEVLDTDPEFSKKETNYAYRYVAGSGALHIVMNGTGSQVFSSQKIMNRGGTTVIKGSLKYNFNQNAQSYTYYTQELDNPTIFVSAWNAATGGVKTTYSHGNLRMRGGEFGSTDGDASYGSFRFTNIEYTAGTIKLRLNSATQIDSLDLTGYYLETIDGGVANPIREYVAGGTILKTDGVTGKVTFDFGNNLMWLIDDGFGEFDINGGKGAKIISWDAANKTTLTAEDFAGNSFTRGDDYEAKFTVTDDGLYVKYVQAIPESATIAALFGALALGFAAYKRRK